MLSTTPALTAHSQPNPKHAATLPNKASFPASSLQLAYLRVAMEGLSVGAKIPSPPGAGKEGGKGGKGVGVGVEGGGVGGVGGGGGSGSGVGGKDEVWDEERLCEGLRRLEEMHNKLNSLRSVIPHMLSPLCPPQINQFASPAALFETFSRHAVSASEDLLSFTKLWQGNRSLIEYAAVSRAKSREGIRRWGLKDGMPPGVVVVGEEEGREEKGREDRRRKAEREVREKEREKKRRRSAAGGGVDVGFDDDGGEGVDEEEEEEGSKEEEEERRREREEVEESGRDPRDVVVEFSERLENPGEGDAAAKRWRGVKVEYIDRPTMSLSSLPPSQTMSTSPQIKITLPAPTHLQFTIEITTLPPTPSSPNPSYKYTLPHPPTTILPTSLTGSPIAASTSSSHPLQPNQSQSQSTQQQPHLHTSLLRAITSRPQPTQNNLSLLLEMVCEYTGLYTERCVGCGRLVYEGARAELPVVRRRGKRKGVVGVKEKDGEKEEGKGGLEWFAWHDGCFEGVGVGVGVGGGGGGGK